MATLRVPTPRCIIGTVCSTLLTAFSDVNRFLRVSSPTHCYMVQLPCEPQKMWCVSQDLATGKTNQDRKIFGWVMRHRHADLCGVGAFAMYLALRFHITQEFVDYPPLENWLDGSKWFDIKLLVDAFNPNCNRCDKIRNDTYSKAIKTVLNEHCLPSNHFVHLGRKLGGSPELEMKNADAWQIDQLGNWATGVRANTYSNKMPVQAIMLKAGFKCSRDHLTHCNFRQSITVPDVLLFATPFWWCYDVIDYLKTEMSTWHINRDRPTTAMHFLDLMHHLNIVFLQDMATIWIERADRRDHPIYSQHLPVFQMEDWKAFLVVVERTLIAEAETAAAESSRGMEKYLPGIQDQFARVLNQRIHRAEETIREEVQQLRKEVVSRQVQIQPQQYQAFIQRAVSGVHEQAA
jgi:Centromere DNA-binding protein complex CBF3 subunit, domain 2